MQRLDLSYEEQAAADRRELSPLVSVAPTWKLHATVASFGALGRELFPAWEWGRSPLSVDILVKECAFELINRQDSDGLTTALFAREAIRTGGLSYDADFCDTLEWCVRKDADVGAIASYVSAFHEPGSYYAAGWGGALKLFRANSPWCQIIIVALAERDETKSAAKRCIEELAQAGAPITAQIIQTLVRSQYSDVADLAHELSAKYAIVPSGEPIEGLLRSQVGLLTYRMANVMRARSKTRARKALENIHDEVTDPRLRLCVSSMLTVHRWDFMREQGLAELKARGVPWAEL